MRNGYPTEEELYNRITNHLNHRGATDTVALLWHGYLAALLEWALIDINAHLRLLNLLPRVGIKELDELFADEPISLEREKEIEEYEASLAKKLLVHKGE